MRFDGLYITKNKPVVTLVNFGNIPSTIFRDIEHSFKGFFKSQQKELNQFPHFNLINRPDPLITRREESRLRFEQIMNQIPGKIVVGVTNQGIYDIDRYIFGFGWCDKGLLSNYRFIKTNKRPQKIKERLAKEVIKILSLAIGVPHCSNQDCILTYHTSVVDLDKNTGICNSCREHMVKNLNHILKE